MGRLESLSNIVNASRLADHISLIQIQLVQKYVDLVAPRLKLCTNFVFCFLIIDGFFLKRPLKSFKATIFWNQIPYSRNVQCRMQAVHKGIERLMEGAELAASAGICLGLEPLASVLLPPMIVQRLDDALDLIDRMQMPNVKLLFDTAHVQALEGDAAAQFERAYPYVETLQLADHPGRLEPGTGSVDFRRILGFAMAHRFSGLVELEHHWLKETSEAETSGVAALRILDQQARAMYEIGRC